MDLLLKKDPNRRIIMDDLREQPWVTDQGEEPMLSREQNLYFLGAEVSEPTQQELHLAISSLRSIL